MSYDDLRSQLPRAWTTIVDSIEACRIAISITDVMSLDDVTPPSNCVQRLFPLFVNKVLYSYMNNNAAADEDWEDAQFVFSLDDAIVDVVFPSARYGYFEIRRGTCGCWPSASVFFADTLERLADYGMDADARDRFARRTKLVSRVIIPQAIC